VAASTFGDASDPEPAESEASVSVEESQNNAKKKAATNKATIPGITQKL
jgi:hypothetical protein